MNLLKEEIEQFGVTIDSSIQKASGEIQGHIDQIGDELSKQRSLTTADLQSLVDYAASRFGQAIDERIRSAKTEIASLVTEKLAEVRLELTEAATEQKRTAVRNATVGVIAAICIGLVSLAYRTLLHGEIDLLAVFRAFLAAVAVGHAVWLLSRALSRFMTMNRLKRNLVVAGAQYFGVLRARGVAGHLLLLAFMVAAWLIVNYWPQLRLVI